MIGGACGSGSNNPLGEERGVALRLDRLLSSCSLGQRRRLDGLDPRTRDDLRVGMLFLELSVYGDLGSGSVV